jgi:heat shock protein 5
LQQYETIPLSSPGDAAIHLGNTKSCIAAYGGRSDPYTAYQFCIPSWVAFTDNGTLVGEAAMNHAAISPGTAVSGFKRLFGIRQVVFSFLLRYALNPLISFNFRTIGQDWLDSLLVQNRIDNEMVKREAELVPYQFTRQAGRCGIQMETEEGHVMNFLPERVAGILIAELKKMAEARLGHKIGYAVVTVPAHFNDAQRSYVRNEAARLHGGFSAVNVVDEDVAAAAAYRLHEKRADGKVVLVIHLGGRTTHATKFKFKDGSGRLLQARHDAYLGGMCAPHTQLQILFSL